MITPVYDPDNSGVTDDPRLPYYAKVAGYTNIYTKAHLKWGGSYGRKFTQSLPREHMHLDDIVK